MEKLNPMYFDKGEFKSMRDGKTSREYNLWKGIRSRCFYNSSKKDNGYMDCNVAEEFHSFQAFASWVTKQVGFHSGFQLDKDLIVKGNRIYGPDRCVFLPLEINSILIKNPMKRKDLPIGVRIKNDQIKKFTSSVSRFQDSVHLGSYATKEEAFMAYKFAKEKILKEVAEKYKGCIATNAYEALINYNVEITD